MIALDHLQTAAARLYRAEAAASLTAPQLLSLAIRSLDAAAALLPPELAARADALTARCADAAQEMIPYLDGLHDEALALIEAAGAENARFDEVEEAA